MTRIGSVTVKYDVAKNYGPTVLQHVCEDGVSKIAEFKFANCVIGNLGEDEFLLPGRVYYISHHRYDRAA